jgi:diaminobutyrate-2-oxoglutarate transaminase
MKPELDVWKPGQHNGTFRGNNWRFVTATAALEHYWSDNRFQASPSRRKAQLIETFLDKLVTGYPQANLTRRGSRHDAGRCLCRSCAG